MSLRYGGRNKHALLQYLKRSVFTLVVDEILICIEPDVPPPPPPPLLHTHTCRPLPSFHLAV